MVSKTINNLIFVQNCEAHSSYRFIPETHANISKHDDGNVCKMPYPVLLLVTLESGISSVSSASLMVETEVNDIVALFLSSTLSFWNFSYKVCF
jgi:hypothetical protein